MRYLTGCNTPSMIGPTTASLSDPFFASDLHFLFFFRFSGFSDSTDLLHFYSQVQLLYYIYKYNKYIYKHKMKNQFLNLGKTVMSWADILHSSDRIVDRDHVLSYSLAYTFVDPRGSYPIVLLVFYILSIYMQFATVLLVKSYTIRLACFSSWVNSSGNPYDS